MSRLSKRRILLLALGFLFLAMGGVSIYAFYTYQKFRLQTPTLPQYAEHAGRPPVGLIFHYSPQTQQQFDLLQKNFGFGDAPHSKIFEIPTHTSGFLFAHIKPQLPSDFIDQSAQLVSQLATLFQELQRPGSSLPLGEEDPVVSIARLMEEIWNAPTLIVGGALRFDLPRLQELQLAFQNQTLPTFLSRMLQQSFPQYLNDWAKRHALNLNIKSIQEGPLHHWTLTLQMNNAWEFLESICSGKLNPWDFCGQFQLDRDNFRQKMALVLGILNDQFSIKINFYGMIKGTSVAVSNSPDYLLSLQSLPLKHQRNTFTHTESNIFLSLSESGFDLLVPQKHASNKSTTSLVFDMVNLQNTAISFLEELKNRSDFFASFFSSPSGEDLFSRMEKSVNHLTTSCEQMALSVATDGKSLYPEVRMLSPSDDMFTEDKQNISPEIFNQMKLWMTRLISLNRSLRTDLLPLPSPQIKRNGPWVIVQSEVSAEELSRYLEEDRDGLAL